MSRLNQQYMDVQCGRITKQISDLNNKVDTFSKRDEVQDKHLLKTMTQLNKSLDEKMQQKVDPIDQKVDSLDQKVDSLDQKME